MTILYYAIFINTPHIIDKPTVVVVHPILVVADPRSITTRAAIIYPCLATNQTLHTYY